MKTVAGMFKNLDPVVVALTDTIGLAIFPSILDISPPVPDHVCNVADFRYFGGTVGIEPFRELCALKNKHGHVVYVVERLKSLIGFIQVGIGL